MTNINLDSIPFEAYEAVRDLDYKFVGTDNYMGIAWFHDMAYKHLLRDCSIAQRRKIHQKLLYHSCDVHGTSLLHDEIIYSVLKGKKLDGGHVVNERDYFAMQEARNEYEAQYGAIHD